MNRITKLRETFPSLGVDGIMITCPANRRYMTGFTGSAGLALISPTEAKLLTDFRYVEQAAEQAKEYEIVRIQDSLYDQTALEAEKMGITHLAFEQDHITYRAYKKYKEKMKAKMTPASGVVENLRMIKSEQEIEKLRKAAEIADLTFAHILGVIRPGITEKAIADEMEFFMRKNGADCSAFDLIVASGPRAALPHGVASDKTIGNGDMVILDFGAYYQGYRSDMTRTVAVGDPGNRLKEVYQIVWRPNCHASKVCGPESHARMWIRPPMNTSNCGVTVIVSAMGPATESDWIFTRNLFFQPNPIRICNPEW